MTAAVSKPPLLPAGRTGPAFAVAFVLIAALMSWLGFALQPKLQGVSFTQADFDRMFPSEFGDWKEVKTITPLVSAANPGELTFNQPYDAQIMRTYRNSQNQVIMLAVAYGQNQRQDIKVHRPEVCYKAGGFSVGPVQAGQIELPGHRLAVSRLVATMPERQEPITYWRLLGDRVVTDELHFKLDQITARLKGRGIDDGLLVRVSSLGVDAEAAWRLQADFVQALDQAQDEAQRRRTTGARGDSGL